ncbi:hypothetical protein D9C73_015898 [Collichthys lucidus]|uniref:Uncharacterized protein n=1 Tax=Collichthys lucidus TaxID=240159 RepID=A0A4V6AQU0_COLLU|nr:hypothetical protein D9C73_015898 [Collichthys lucidus]
MTKPSAAKEAVKNSDIFVLEAHDLLLKAQLLMDEIEEMHLDINRPLQPHEVPNDQQQHQASTGDNRETLVIEGFGFKSAVSRENLRSPQAGTGGCQDGT